MEQPERHPEQPEIDEEEMAHADMENLDPLDDEEFIDDADEPANVVEAEEVASFQ